VRVQQEPELPAPGHRVRADPQLLAAVQRGRQAGHPPRAGEQPVAAPPPASVAARQACRVPDGRRRVAVVLPDPGGLSLAAVLLDPGDRSRAATQARGDAEEAVRGLCRVKEARSAGESAAAYLAHSLDSRRIQGRS
jgi:hypothetical protein